MVDQPPVPKRTTPSVPETRLTSTEMEAVIARAIELHQREEERSGDEGIDAAELVRIAGELGLAPSHVHQAIAEVRGKPAAEQDLLSAMLGQRHVGVSRHIQMPAAKAREQIERYLTDKEAMVVLRRHSDRTIFERGAGVGAVVARAASVVGARHPLLRAKTMSVSVTAVDEKSCFVALAIDMAELRTGTAVGTGMVGLSGAAGAAVIGIVLAPPLALAAVPVVGGFAWIMRVTYQNAIKKRLEQLESLLDRLEHKELIEPPGVPNLLKRFGL